MNRAHCPDLIEHDAPLESAGKCGHAVRVEDLALQHGAGCAELGGQVRLLGQRLSGDTVDTSLQLLELRGGVGVWSFARLASADCNPAAVW